MIIKIVCISENNISCHWLTFGVVVDFESNCKGVLYHSSWNSYFLIFQDFYNFLQDSDSDSNSINAMELGLSKEVSIMRYSKYLMSKISTLGSEDEDLEKLLNGVIRKKLKIIPENVTWVYDVKLSQIQIQICDLTTTFVIMTDTKCSPGRLSRVLKEILWSQESVR